MTKNSFAATKVAVYDEIIEKDCYILRAWGTDFFDNIVDIGASVGCFTLYAHMRHPKSNIFAYEPCLETFQYLTKENGFMNRVSFFNKALGDGLPMSFYDVGFSGSNIFYKAGENNLPTSYEVQSSTLSSIFKDNKIALDSRYYIKIDCEGGERFLLGDAEAVDIIKNSCSLGMEVHHVPIGGAEVPRYVHERFGCFPTLEEYDSWLRDSFSSTHRVVYHYDQKHLGLGTYVLLSKKYAAGSPE